MISSANHVNVIVFYIFDVYDPIQGLKKPLPIDKYQPSKIIWGTEPDVSKRTHLLQARALLAVSNEHYAQNEITVDNSNTVKMKYVNQTIVFCNEENASYVHAQYYLIPQQYNLSKFRFG